MKYDLDSVWIEHREHLEKNKKTKWGECTAFQENIQPWGRLENVETREGSIEGSDWKGAKRNWCWVRAETENQERCLGASGKGKPSVEKTNRIIG